MSWRNIIGGALLALLLIGCGAQGRVVGRIPWSLESVSEDARVLRVRHEIPHCQTEPGKPVVREGARSVTIRIPEVETGHDGACTLDLRVGSSLIRLRAPLGDRTLRGEETTNVPIPTSPVPLRSECVRLDKMAAQAPARAVAWVAKRIHMCHAPIPKQALALPFRRPPRTAADDLPGGRAVREALDGANVVLRPDLARRIDATVPAWWIPGPRTSCILRGDDSGPTVVGCRPTRVVAQRGLFLTTTCASSTPSMLAVIGAVPAGVRVVRLVPRRGHAITVPVRGGVWAGQAPYPFEITYGGVRLRLGYETRSCWR